MSPNGAVTGRGERTRASGPVHCEVRRRYSLKDLVGLQQERLRDREAKRLRGLEVGVAMEFYEERHDVEEVRGLLGHARLETTQLYAQIRPATLKHAVEFYEAKALDLLSE